MKIAFNEGVIFPIYILIWPILFAFVEIEQIQLIIDTDIFLIDLRLVFYLLFFILIILKIFSGISYKSLSSLSPIAVWFCCYLISFVLNMEHNSNYKDFLNGFFLFSVMYTYVLVYRDSINWNNVVSAYAVSIITITVFGFYSFNRFEGGLNLLSGSLSEQLWRLCGRKSQYIPSVIILYALYFHTVSKREPNWIINIATLLATISIILSGQRTAIIALLYFALIFLFYSHSIKRAFIIILIFSAYVFYQESIQLLIEHTFSHKLRSVESYEVTRIDIWTITLNCLLKNPGYFIFGVSEGGLPSVGGSSWPMDSNNPHNMLLYFWASTGLIGVIVLLAVIIILGRQVHRKQKIYIILLYWIILFYFLFGGFYFYVDSVRSDFLNIGIMIILFYLFKPAKRINSYFANERPPLGRRWFRGTAQASDFGSSRIRPRKQA